MRALCLIAACLFASWQAAGGCACANRLRPAGRRTRTFRSAPAIRPPAPRAATRGALPRLELFISPHGRAQRRLLAEKQRHVARGE